MSQTLFAPKIIEMLDASHAAGTKFPKIRLQTADGNPILLYRAGPKAGGGRYEGCCTITDGAFINSIFYGRVDRGTKEIFVVRNRSDQGIAEAIEAFDRQPEAVARMYGAMQSECCFCEQALTDPRSDPQQGGAGYGPTCAKKFGLPWGDIRPMDLEGLAQPESARFISNGCRDGWKDFGESPTPSAQEDFATFEASFVGEGLRSAAKKLWEKHPNNHDAKRADLIVSLVLGATDSTASEAQFRAALAGVKELLDVDIN